MAQFLVRLEGQQLDLNILVNLSGDSWVVVKEGDAFYLTSDDWNLLEDPSDVHGPAGEVIALLNGAACIYLNNFEAVRLSGVVTRRQHDRSNDVSVAAITAVARRRYPPQLTHGTQPIDAWIDSAKRDAHVQKALALYGSLEHSWRNLYLVLEAVEDGCGGEKALLASNWCEAERVKLFKRTANNWQALGVDARHAKEKWEKPDSLMSLHEARAAIRSTLLAWLQNM